MAGRLQNEDFKSLAELTAAGGTVSQLLNDDKVYITANGLNQQLKTAIAGGLIGGGSGGVGKNYISNASGTYNLSGATTFANGSAIPTTGTGGTPTLALSTTTTNPLVSGGNYLITPGGLGDGINVAFSINSADQAKMFQISFDYFFGTPSSYSDGQYSVYIRDNTNGVLIYPSTSKILGKIGYGNPFRVTFQTASNSTSYSLLIVQTVAAASTTSIQLANLFVGPQVTSVGPAMSDYQSFTPTGSWTTNTTYAGAWKREGDLFKGHVLISLAGAPNATPLSINLPFGLNIDVTKRANAASATISNVLGTGKVYNNGTIVADLTFTYNNTTSIQVSAPNSNGTSAYNQVTNVTATSPFTFGASMVLDMDFEVPIVGWSSNTVISSDAGASKIATLLNLSSTQSVGAGQTAKITPFAVSKDLAGSWDSAAQLFRSPTADFYDINFELNISAVSTFSLQYRVNGGAWQSGPGYTGTTIGSANWVVFLNVNDTLEFGLYTANAITTVIAYSSLFIGKRGYAQTLAASETISCSYGSSSGQSLSANTETTLLYAVRYYDDHTAYNTATGVWTCPANGRYRLSAQMTYPPVGGMVAYLGARDQSNNVLAFALLPSSASSTSVAINKTLNMLQGQTITLRGIVTVACSVTTDPSYNYFSIEKVG